MSESEFSRRIAEAAAHTPPPPPPTPPTPKRSSVIVQAVRRSFFTIVLLFIAIQAIPYGRGHANPPITSEPQWDSESTWQISVRACFDCHSNRTNWPWYSNIAPVSWVIQHDVDEGRGKMNFSEWERSQRDARDAGKDVREGKMPLWYYLAARPEARLSPQEARDFAAGLDATIGRKR